MAVERVSPEYLRWQCFPEEFPFSHTGELEVKELFLGQERARKALSFGLSLGREGYNLYVAGPEGVGKTSHVLQLLKTLCARRGIPSDWCYVNNFSNPQTPIALSLPPGRGRELRQEMLNLIETLKKDFPKAFESKEFDEKLHEVTDKGRREREQVMAELTALAEERGFTIKFSPAGVVLVPLIGGKVIPEEEILKNAYLRELIEHRRKEFDPVLKDYLRRLRTIDKEIHQDAVRLREEVARFVVNHHMDDMIEEYDEFPKVKSYLGDVREDLVRNSDIFLEFPAARENPLLMLQLERSLSRYQVNVIVDNGSLTCAPVVYETHPTYTNLFGRIGLRAELGVYVADFQQIIPGSIHRANGGFLVLKVLELFRNIGVWNTLKRALNHKEISIQPLIEELGLPHPVTTLRPEPIPLDIKVVLIGERLHYHLLMALDPEFEGLFKVKADFDTVVDNTPEVRTQYSELLAFLIHKERLLPLDASAVTGILEHSARLSEDRKKLSIRLGKIVDLLRESSFWAQQEGREKVTLRDVEKALDEKVYRINLLEEKLRELIKRDVILIHTEGEEVGQCNGLSIIDLMDYSFGRPNRISAKAFVGEKGIVNIEREADLSGKVFNKAVLILSGYLGHQYGRVSPLSLSATLAFEQSYSMVEGDSASAAELAALLSAISEVPLKQCLAVTGSVDQRGFVQPVGGINEKIEGFYYCCREKGFTREQGVVFPRVNLDNLQLRKEVVESVKRGEFCLYAVSHIDDVLKLLTGMEPGVRGPDEKFPQGTFHREVEEKLMYFREVFLKKGKEKE